MVQSTSIFYVEASGRHSITSRSNNYYSREQESGAHFFFRLHVVYLSHVIFNCRLYADQPTNGNRKIHNDVGHDVTDHDGSAIEWARCWGSHKYAGVFLLTQRCNSHITN